ncbi:MAG TPA: glucosamine-6-phosphate deaminase [Chloroflexota bacterium]|nr:glucosamine-6-phosphate deaminase [Chloroflexota bacterium]
MVVRPSLSIVEDAAKGARVVADRLEELIRSRPDAVLALPTGRTPIPLYAELTARYRRGQIDFARVRTFNLDEWVGVAAGSPGSYAAFMTEHLFSRVNLARENCHLPNGAAPDLDDECARYERLIREVGGIDLAVLGIGHNGHIGFNEPGTPFESRTHVARVTPQTRESNRWTFADGRVPDTAITVGIATILGARGIVLLATGQDKASIVARALTCAVAPSIPASALQLHPNVQVIADAAAGGWASEISDIS